jgi:hypothetical protein
LLLIDIDDERFQLVPRRTLNVPQCVALRVRLRDAMKKRGLADPLFELRQSNQASVSVTLKNDKASRSKWVETDIAGTIAEKLLSKLDEYDRRLIRFALENNRTIKVVQAQTSWTSPIGTPPGTDWIRLVELGLFVKVRRFERDPNMRYELTSRIKKKSPPATIS